MKTITKCLGILTSAAVSLTVMDRLLEQQEKKNFQPYGSPLKTEFGNMTIVKAGTQGPQIVLLNGYGSASPYLEFKPLMLSLLICAGYID